MIFEHAIMGLTIFLKHQWGFLVVVLDVGCRVVLDRLLYLICNT